MQFSRELRDDVRSGAITVSYRLWRRPKVKEGGRGDPSIEPADVARTGEQDRESLRRRAAHAGPIDDDTLVYRIEFHVV